MDKKLTINDIARMSGVAKSTVSRYLNEGSVRDATAQKIRRVIEENNYEPNMFARLSAKNSRIIGLIVPGFNSVTTPQLVEAIVAYLKREDYTPLIMHTGNCVEEEIRSIERLVNMRADGIMILATTVGAAHREAVARSEVPILFLGQLFPEGTSIINDDFHAGEALGKYLGRQGLKRVTVLWVGEEDPAVGVARKKGVMEGLRREGVEQIQVVETSFFFQEAVEHAREILEKGPYPDAIVCATDRIAEGAYQALRERGLRIPEDVSVAGFGDYETSQLLMPPLTTVRFDLQHWGEISAETMLQMVQGKPVGRLQINTFQLMERGSVCKKEGL